MFAKSITIVITFLILFWDESFQQIHFPKSCNMERYLNYDRCSGLDSETEIVGKGGEYLDTECSVYVLPNKGLKVLPCPLHISHMSASDVDCYRVYYRNGSIRDINIKLAMPPTGIDFGRKVDLEPFNGEYLILICPLYGSPGLNYTWSIQIKGKQYPGINQDKLYHLKSTRDKENNGSILENLYYFQFDPHCPTGLIVSYYDYANIDGNYFCTGTNEFGNETALAANIEKGGKCLSPDNNAFYDEGEVIIELQREYKVSSGDIGFDFNLTCKVLPYTNKLRVAWMLDNEARSLCEDNGEVETLSSNEKYTISDQRDDCIKISSLIIHDLGESDMRKYHCAAQLCLASAVRNLTAKSVEVVRDRETVLETDWVFSFTALPILIAVATTVILSIVTYVNKVRLIRWYIAWKREEPKGQFEYDVFVCIPEEYDQELIGQVRDEIIYQLLDVRILWQEGEDCNSVGRNHYDNATDIMKKCRKFIFIVNERFMHCFFCKQMVELVTEKSKTKNWNIILPVKWTNTTTVPRELLVYRYVEREGDMTYLREMENFLRGKPVVNRKRSTINYHRVLFSKSYDRTSLLISKPLINL